MLIFWRRASSSLHLLNSAGICHVLLLLYRLTVGVTMATESCDVQTNFYSIPERDALKGYMLVDHVMMKAEVSSAHACLSWCAAMCWCVSFNVGNPGYQQTQGLLDCQLNSEDNVTFRDSLVPNAGYTYYNIRVSLKGARPGCTDYQCDYRCCSVPYCIHATDCIDVCDSSKYRYHCACAKGYIGNNCQYQAPSSCQEYFKNNPRATSGQIKVQDKHGDIFPVFCYKEPSTDIVWNLLFSFSMENKELFRKPLYKNSPINEQTPNWTSYRMSRTQMVSLFAKSTFWKFACNFDKSFAHSEVDFALGRSSMLDILSFKGENCRTIESLNIRGASCTNCTAYAFQGYGQMSVRPVAYSFGILTGVEVCDFQRNVKFSTYEMNFGNYQWFNPRFSCASGDHSTTQLWVGSRV